MKSFLDKKIKVNNNNVFLEGSYYIISSTACFLTKKQVEACINVVRFYIKRYKKKKNFVSRIQFKIPITKKSKGSRMGSGKGKIKEYISKINMNSILFVFKKIKLWKVFKIFKAIQYRLPMKIYLKY